MREIYYDAVSIVCEYDKPDMFITMTCDPHWREIENCL